jgi:cysteine desulfurase/selenocysteine lyase
MIDPRALRREFPIYERNPGLVFLDSGASAQKPRVVIDGIADFYRSDYANVHRGVYQLSQRSTDAFEAARQAARAFLNAADEREIVFVRGATEAINLVSYSWCGAFLRPGDEIVISDLEHHSNLVPWQMACRRAGARLVVAPTDETGEFDLAAYAALLSPRTRLVAVTHVSNVTGTIMPVAAITRLAHEKGAAVLVDGCQAVPHMPVDVQAIGCDFYVFSGHKLYGPTGTGILYGRYDALEAMPPWQTGGSMISHVAYEGTEFLAPPHRFEAGTPDIAGAVGLARAIGFVEGIGRDNIQAHDEALTGYAVDVLSRLPGIELVAGGQRRTSVLSFNLDGVHPHDVGTVLDQHEVAVRVGHHCAQPLMDKLGLAGTVRASLGIYNDAADIDRLAAAVEACREMFLR